VGFSYFLTSKPLFAIFFVLNWGLLVNFATLYE
jgi:hypothetical protein